MRYFKVNEQLEVVQLSDKYPAECSAVANDPNQCQAPWARKFDGSFGAGWLNRNDISVHPSPWLFAQQIADSASKFTGRTFLAIDNGDHVSPRYEVIEAPSVGDEVSKGFNGDFYHVGQVVKIGKNYKQITVQGKYGTIKFYRKGLRGCWLQPGGTWGLVPGVRNEMNPEF